MVKEEGTFAHLSKNGVLFKKLIENSGKMEEHEENANVENSENRMIGLSNEVFKDANQCKLEERKSILIKQEERETGVVSWDVLMRYWSFFFSDV